MILLRLVHDACRMLLFKFEINNKMFSENYSQWNENYFGVNYTYKIKVSIT